MFVKNYFLSLEKCLKDYYKAAVKRAKTQQRLDELDKFIEHDLGMLNSIRDAILGNPRKKIEGTLDFFAKSKHKKDPFKYLIIVFMFWFMTVFPRRFIILFCKLLRSLIVGSLYSFYTDNVRHCL